MLEFFYQCSGCGKRYSRNEVRYLCPVCAQDYHPGMPLKGVLEAIFDYPAIGQRAKSGKPNWQLFSAVEKKYFPPYPVGHTPFSPVQKLGQKLGFTSLWLKNDGLNPSGSLKDRASFLVVAEARRLGEKVIVTASTGNAASALAAVCACTDTQAVILVPASAPKAKLLQMILYGACVIPIRGTYDDAFALSLQLSQAKGWLNRNTAYHPLTIEGKKTVGLEIFSQNGYRVPEAILVPVGDGVIISGVYKAFYDLKMAGCTTHLPRLICVQAERSNAIHHYLTSGQYQNAAEPTTIADSISVSIPSNAHLARRAVIASNGFSLTVTDEEILQGQALLAQTTGVFAEPSSSTVVAALTQIAQQQLLAKDAQIVLLITGHGLKDVDTPLAHLHLPPAVEPVLEDVLSCCKKII